MILIVRGDAFFFLPRGKADDLSFGSVAKGSVLILLGAGERGVGEVGLGANTEGVTECRYLLIFPLTDNEGCFWLVEGDSHRLPNTDWEAIQAQLKTLLGRE